MEQSQGGRNPLRINIVGTRVWIVGYRNLEPVSGPPMILFDSLGVAALDRIDEIRKNRRGYDNDREIYKHGL